MILDTPMFTAKNANKLLPLFQTIQRYTEREDYQLLTLSRMDR